MADAGEIFKDIAEAAPAIKAAAEMVAGLIDMWRNGGADDKAAAEAQAQAMTDAGKMNDARSQYVSSHADNQKKIADAIEAAEHPPVVVPPKMGE